MLPRFAGPASSVSEEILFRASRKVVLPNPAESFARLLECRCGTAADLAGPVGLRIKAERPALLVDIVRNTGALGDRADANVIIEDSPGFLMDALHSAAGETVGGLRR